jgi:hypothetical protein
MCACCALCISLTRLVCSCCPSQVAQQMHRLCKQTIGQLEALWVDPSGITLHEEVGRGGSGEVYRATDSGGRVLAAKLITGLYLPAGDLQSLLEAADSGTAALRRELVVMARLAQGLDGVCRWAVEWAAGQLGSAHWAHLRTVAHLQSLPSMQLHTI